MLLLSSTATVFGLKQGKVPFITDDLDDKRGKPEAEEPSTL
ncbi:hypothetical protein [Psychrobacter sp.]